MTPMRTLALWLALAACSSSKTTSPDSKAIDAPAGAACTGKVYDPCTTVSTTSTECMSANCHFYNMSNLTVCTQACSAANPCPNDSAGTPGVCNAMGICKPSVANSCSR
jgi:hypothetical protein